VCREWLISGGTFQLHSDDDRDIVIAQLLALPAVNEGSVRCGANRHDDKLENSQMRALSRIALNMGIVLAALTPAVGADEKDAVEYREHLMKTLHEQSEALGQILSGAIPDDNATAHMDQVALAASLSLKAFEAKVPGGEAKAAVWSNWPDFSKRMNEFAQKTAAAAKAAHDSGKETGLAQLSDALTCKSCHELYRQEKK
jgi:cytochrome c556